MIAGPAWTGCEASAVHAASIASRGVPARARRHLGPRRREVVAERRAHAAFEERERLHGVARGCVGARRGELAADRENAAAELAEPRQAVGELGDVIERHVLESERALELQQVAVEEPRVDAEARGLEHLEQSSDDRARGLRTRLEGRHRGERDRAQAARHARRARASSRRGSDRARSRARTRCAPPRRLRPACRRARPRPTARRARPPSARLRRRRGRARRIIAACGVSTAARGVHEPGRVERARRRLAERLAEGRAVGDAGAEIGGVARGHPREPQRADVEPRAHDRLPRGGGHGRRDAQDADDARVVEAPGAAERHVVELIERAREIATREHRPRASHARLRVAALRRLGEVGERDRREVVLAERRERRDERRRVDRRLGPRRGEPLERAPRIASKIGLARVRPREHGRRRAPRLEDLALLRPRLGRLAELLGARRDRLVEAARVEQRARADERDEAMIGRVVQALALDEIAQEREAPLRRGERSADAHAIGRRGEHHPVVRRVPWREARRAIADDDGLVVPVRAGQREREARERRVVARVEPRAERRGVELDGDVDRLAVTVPVRQRPQRRELEHAIERREVARVRRTLEAHVPIEERPRLVGIEREHAIVERTRARVREGAEEEHGELPAAAATSCAIMGCLSASASARAPRSAARRARTT